MSTVTAIYDEFIGDNLYKRYPLVDAPESYSGFELPDSFLADVTIMVGTMDRVGDDAYRYSIYISRVEVHTDYIYLTFADSKGSAIAESDPIPVGLTLSDTVNDRTHKINPTTKLPVQGAVVVGTCEDISKLPGIHTMNQEYSLLFPSCVATVPPAVIGIQVGDTIFDGVVTLEAGDYIGISYDENTNKITIAYDPTNGPADLIYDESSLLQAVTEKYGKPIITINGEVKPDEKGNIEINPTDCFMIETDTVNHSISMYNPCANPCSSYEFLDNTLARINDLNKSVSLLKSMNDSVANTLAQMGVRVASVLESRKGGITATK